MIDYIWLLVLREDETTTVLYNYRLRAGGRFWLEHNLMHRDREVGPHSSVRIKFDVSSETELSSSATALGWLDTDLLNAFSSDLSQYS